MVPMKISPLTVLALVLPLAACSQGTSSDRTTVVAGLYPFAYVAQQVGGADVTVENLTTPGVEPHDLELTGRQVASVSEADLVIHFHDLQPAVDSAITDKESALDIATVVKTKHGDEPGHGESEGHDHGAVDPHVWLDPRRMETITAAVRDRLAAVDPSHAATYRTNAARLITKLQRLDADFSAGLKTCDRRTIVTSHAAFGYLASRYRLTQVPIAGLDPANEPSGRQLATITDLVRDEGVTTVFTEELVSPVVAQTVARETGAHTATLNPIEGTTSKKDDYVSLMRANLKAIQQANGCQ
jgi:zinc transport system substrate-binding protein